MFNIKAKHNSANIMLPDESYLDEETRKQIYGFLNHPAFGNSYIAIMPDCHAGAGSCIGFTMKMNDYVIPNIVGVDIGCGVTSVNLGNIDIDLKALDRWIKQNIPHGFNVNTKYMGTPKMYADIATVSYKIKSNIERNRLSVGSLGGGNHFIEIGVDENQDKWLTVHSGSRKFGLDIANYHQNRAKELTKKMFMGAGAYNRLEFLPIDMGGQEYLDDMEVAQTMAVDSRGIMIDRIVEKLGIWGKLKGQVSSIHNYINFEDKIVRKGAISAHEGEDVIIPFNMVDGLIIGKGKGSSKWNCSAPHGAGRILSRGRAKRELDLDVARKEMKDAGVYTTSLSSKTLDEAKGAYKDKEMILEMIKETVDIEHFVKPIYNFKSES